MEIKKRTYLLMILLILIASFMSCNYFFNEGYESGLKHNSEKGNCLYLGDKGLDEHNVWVNIDDEGMWYCIK